MFHTYVEKADDDANGRVRLKDFVHILEANDVKVALTDFFRILAETQMNSGWRRGNGELYEACRWEWGNL